MPGHTRVLIDTRTPSGSNYFRWFTLDWLHQTCPDERVNIAGCFSGGDFTVQPSLVVMAERPEVCLTLSAPRLTGVFGIDHPMPLRVYGTNNTQVLTAGLISTYECAKVPVGTHNLAMDRPRCAYRKERSDLYDIQDSCHMHGYATTITKKLRARRDPVWCMRALSNRSYPYLPTVSVKRSNWDSGKHPYHIGYSGNWYYVMSPMQLHFFRHGPTVGLAGTAPFPGPRA